MNNREAQLLVARTMELHLQDPGRPIISILQEVKPLIDGVINLEWEPADPVNPDLNHPVYDNELFPPSPFAELLRQAFAPSLDPREMLFAGRCMSGNGDHALEQRCVDAAHVWELQVIGPFYEAMNLPWRWVPRINHIWAPDDYVPPPLSRDVWMMCYAAHQIAYGGRPRAGACWEAQLMFERHPDCSPAKLSEQRLAQAKSEFAATMQRSRP